MSIWIVEEGVFRTGTGEFEEAVRSAGGELRWLSVNDEMNGRYGRWSKDEAVLFRGSFEAADSFRHRRPDAIPGVVGEFESLMCSSYYPALGGRLLNAEHEFVPLGELRKRWSELQRRFGDILFVRPASGAKAFTGQVVSDLGRFELRERPYLDAMDLRELVIVASPRQIVAEWRTVIVGKDMVAGSRYKSQGERDVDPDVPADVLGFAQETASHITPPAPAYMLDVAREEDGRLSVVELNSFSCSDLYACSPASVVEAVERWVTELRHENALT